MDTRKSSLALMLFTSLAFAQPLQAPDSSIYTVVKSAFVVESYGPDGDSARFIANNTKDWDLLENAQSIHRAYLDTPSNNNQTDPDKKNSVQLRFEGIDTPEFGDGDNRQPYGKEARDYTLSYLGYKNLEYTPKGKEVRQATPNRIRAVLLTRAAPNGTNGRPVVYVYREKDWTYSQESRTPIKAEWLETSLNYQLLEQGFAYPEMYLSQPKAHREAFKKAVVQARKTNAGIWKLDQSQDFSAPSFENIGENGALILPKLYRRMDKYFTAQQKQQTDLTFFEYLRTGKADNDRLLYQGKRLKLSDLLEQRGTQFNFNADLSEIVFEE